MHFHAYLCRAMSKHACRNAATRKGTEGIDWVGRVLASKLDQVFFPSVVMIFDDVCVVRSHRTRKNCLETTLPLSERTEPRGLRALA